MLVLTRSGKPGDAAIYISHAGEQIEVRAWAAGGGRVKVGFVGPRTFVVARGEVAKPGSPSRIGAGDRAAIARLSRVYRAAIARLSPLTDWPAEDEATEGDKP